MFDGAADRYRYNHAPCCCSS